MSGPTPAEVGWIAREATAILLGRPTVPLEEFERRRDAAVTAAEETL